MVILAPNELPRVLTEAREYGSFEIEIGCGNGHFLNEYGKVNPATLLLGIEFKNKRCMASRKKIEKNNLSNLRIMQAKAEDVINQLPAESVDKYHIYFPDPWPKQKHRRRRFLRMVTLNTIVSTLKPGGEIHFLSDIMDYTLQSKILFALHPDLTVNDSVLADEVCLSVYANKFRLSASPMHAVTAKKKDKRNRQRLLRPF
ncbi:MAG: methyltransferase domain-containing protein [Spirochaetales bacterium]|nr:methyltransferase domain-containing protein [Spirochaetales bacterium]